MSGPVLTLNAGSSSIKLALLDEQGDPLARRDAPAGADWIEEITALLDEAPEPWAAGHRVVHGGERFTEPTVIDDRVESEIEGLCELAPLHNPPVLAGIRALRQVRPNLPAVACFDTAFHHALPAAAAAYALPQSWSRRWELRRFGFHGLSHAYCAGRASALVEQPLEELRIVTAHLGAGASLAAVSGGHSVDTTMGFTPMDGLVMATRPGSLDPGLLLWVIQHGGVDPAEAERALEHEAGLLGISGSSGDIRELLALAEDGDAPATLALDVYVHRLASSVAAMAAAMEGIDVLAFTGGVGENSAEIRSCSCERLRFLGMALDEAANNRATDDADLATKASPVRIVRVGAREDRLIAEQVRATLS